MAGAEEILNEYIKLFITKQTKPLWQSIRFSPRNLYMNPRTQFPFIPFYGGNRMCCVVVSCVKRDEKEEEEEGRKRGYKERQQQTSREP